MNDLKYRLIIDNKTKRQVLILSLLLESSSSILLSEISHYSNVSKKTTISDVQNLIGDLRNSLQLILGTGTPSLKRIGDIAPIKKILFKLTEDNILFKVIEGTFYNKYETIDTLSENFFISENTLRRHLNTLKEVLIDYNLSLNLNPIELIGTEQNIRYFYFQFFSQTHFHNQILSKTEQHKHLYNIIRNIRKKYLMLNLDYHRIIQWFLIIEQRVKSNFFVQFEDTFIEQYSTLHSFYSLKMAMIEEFDEEILSDLNSSEILFIILISLDCIVYDNKSYLLFNDFFSKLNDFEAITTSFFSMYNLHFSVHSEFKMMVQSYLTNISVLSELSPLFQQQSSKIIRLAEQKYSDTFKLWYFLLKDNSTFVHKYDLAASLTILTATQINKYNRVLFSVTGDSIEVSYYKFKAQNLIPKNIDVFFVFNQPIDNVLIENMDIDLCVYNFPPLLPLNKCEVFQFSDSPLESEWQDLLTKLLQIPSL